MVAKVKIEGTNFVNPSEYFKPVAQINSKTPAITKRIQAVVVVITQPSSLIQFFVSRFDFEGDFYIPGKRERVSAKMSLASHNLSFEKSLKFLATQNTKDKTGSMKNTILLPYIAPKNVASLAKQKFDAIVADREMTVEEIIQLATEKKASALVVVPKQKLTKDVIAKLPDSIKIIATSSVGFDHLDIAAAKERGIQLTNTPDVLTECTADIAMLLLLNACRRGREYLEIMEAGWRKPFSQSEMLGIKVSGKTLGIYGMGRIGQAVADRARGFGMKIIYCNRRRLSPDLEKGATYFEKLEDMLPHCQILSLNAPGTADTKYIVNDQTLALLPDNAVLINVARGSLVQEEALIRALQSGKLFAAGLDVFENEPAYDLRLKEFHNVFLTPHMGSATQETRDAMGFRALENIEQALAGKKPQDSLWS
jgi:hydroxypyruvate reductase